MKVAFVYMNHTNNVGAGAGYVAAAARDAGHDVVFFDTFVWPEPEIIGQLSQMRFDVLMISTVAPFFGEALQLIRSVKKKINIPVLMGGSHPTAVGARTLNNHPEIDYVCVGEGEAMVSDFLAALSLRDFSGVSNLAYRVSGKIRQNPVAPPQDLSKLPPFPWEFFSNESVVLSELPGIRYIYVMATRGCPFKCSYCANSAYLDLYGKQYLRFRPISDVIEDLKYLYDRYSPNAFYFGDEMMLSDKHYARELFTATHREIGLPYGCMARVEMVDYELIRHMAVTGCHYIGMGIECGDQKFRYEFLNRKMSNTQIKRAFALAKEAGIYTLSFNMIGFPVEYDEELTEATVNLNLDINPGFASFSIFYPIPGTRLYQYCVDCDLIDREKERLVKDYADESILRGISLSQKKKEIEAFVNAECFNPNLRARAKISSQN
ncbi:MAG: B12-binding domain-containing radical SAM protein [Desulfobacteraceae bacterium]|nr:B12-binding domain-containing radical SAM protein [Desulfobacteraceae bacterium]